MFCCACDGPRDEHQSAPTMTPLSEEFMQPPEFMISSEGPLEMDIRKDQSPSPDPPRAAGPREKEVPTHRLPACDVAPFPFPISREPGVAFLDWAQSSAKDGVFVCCFRPWAFTASPSLILSSAGGGVCVCWCFFICWSYWK